MGKSMYNFGNTVKEKARQQKQMAKAARRLVAKQSKSNMKSDTPDEGKVESNRRADIAEGTV